MWQLWKRFNKGATTVKAKSSIFKLRSLFTEIVEHKHRDHMYFKYLKLNGWTQGRRSCILCKHNIRVEFWNDTQRVVVAVADEDITVYHHGCIDIVAGAWIGVVITDLAAAIESVHIEDVENEADDRQIDKLQRCLVKRQLFDNEYFNAEPTAPPGE